MQVIVPVGVSHVACVTNRRRINLNNSLFVDFDAHVPRDTTVDLPNRWEEMGDCG